MFTEGAFRCLWGAGGLAGLSMWLEVLAASLFTFEATGSGWAVAVVSAARALPLLVFGAVAGVVSESWNRRSVVIAGFLLTTTSALAVASLAAAGLVQPWHLAVAAFVSGAAYVTEFPARRRMVAESAGPDHVDRAVALDSLTSYAARCGGPVLGGFAFQHFGLAGTFLSSAILGMGGLSLVSGLHYPQTTGPLRLSPLWSDLRAALRFASGSSVLVALLAVTVVMNLCGYSYATLITPVGLRALGLDPTLTGVLAAAEPAGALLGGFVLTRALPPGSRLGWLAGGVAMLAAALLGAATLGGLGAPLPTICLVLAAGGCGSAIYTLNQTSLVLAGTPPALRSRVLGLVTVCIGSWPIGMLLAGVLVRTFAPLNALAALALCCLTLLAGVVVWQRPAFLRA